MKRLLLKESRALLLVAASAFLSAFAYQSFAHAADLYPAGFMGLAVLLSQLAQTYLSVQIHFNLIYMVLNLLATVLVLQVAGKRFLILSILQYALTSLLIAVLPGLSFVSDPLLLAVFGGAIAGLSCLCALWADASSGGSDFLTIYLSSKSNSPKWYAVLRFNGAILLIAGLCFGMEQALYSILYQVVATGLISFLHNRYKLINIQIVTDHPDELLRGIFSASDHGVTRVPVLGGYSGQEKTMLFTVANAFESNIILKKVHSLDPAAFVTISRVERVAGDFLQPKLQ